MKLSRPWQYEEAKLIDFLECLVDGFSTFYHLFQPFPVTHVDFGSFFQSGWKTTETSAEPQGYPEIPRCIIIFLKDSSDVYIIIYIYYIILYIYYVYYIYTIYIYIHMHHVQSKPSIKSLGVSKVVSPKKQQFRSLCALPMFGDGDTIRIPLN